ncbi:MAG: hypothetical protein IJ730_01135 [Alphaproteobacteria bacterium]|nr:hypothetical protein [Alphaproteobacteria bacterium]
MNHQIKALVFIIACYCVPSVLFAAFSDNIINHSSSFEKATFPSTSFATGRRSLSLFRSGKLCSHCSKKFQLCPKCLKKFSVINFINVT